MAWRTLRRLLPAATLAITAAACASVDTARPRVQTPLRQASSAPAAVRSNAPIPNPPEKGSKRRRSDAAAVTRALGGYKIGKPYQVAGVWYVPAEQPDYDAVGTASWYGDAFHGRPTANGEAFDMYLASAAHATLPLPSLVEVTNLDNDRSVQVRVNDRGPFKPGRIIDLSREAADQLGFVHRGVAKVRVRYVGPAPLDPLLRTVPAARERPTPLFAERTRPELRPEPTGSESNLVSPPPPTSYAVQAGSFANRGNAERAVRALNAIAPSLVREQQRDGEVLYRVLVGAWPVKDGASAALTAVSEAGFPDARIVTGS